MLKVFALILVLSTWRVPALSADAASRSDAQRWLREYLRIDSSTRPGSLDAAALLRDILHRRGVATRWIVSPTGQPFLYARGPDAQGARPALLLLHHVDVVPPGDGWTQEPFAAEIDRERLFGRGAVDAKSLGIAHLVAFLRFLDHSADATRDVIFLAVGGEESGGAEGLDWLLDNHPELFNDVEAAWTEGGNNRLFGPRLAWWGIEVAQKRPLWLELRAAGRGGHGSSLNLHSAPHRLIRALARLVDRPRDYRLTSEAAQFLEAAAPYESPVFQGVVGRLAEILSAPRPEESLLPGMPNYLLDTIQVNTLAAGDRVNVTPESATARVDIRLLPDTDEAAFLEALRGLLGPDVSIEVLLSAPRVDSSPTNSEVFSCLASALEEKAPVIPAFITAVTDARFLRQRGIPTYGFSPFVLEPQSLRGIHASDEHIPLDAYSAGVETTWEAVQECATN